MRMGIIGLIGLSASVALTCFCGTKSNAPTVEAATTIPISSLKLDSTAVPGWVDSFYVYGDTSQVFQQVDGDAVLYKQKGLGYFSRELMQDGTRPVTLDVFDFVTVLNAKNIFAYTAKNYSAVAWRTYNPAGVAIANSEYYADVFAQINKYFIHMSFYVDTGDSVFVDSCANLFCQKYLSLLK